jgi:hypothetical protein
VPSVVVAIAPMLSDVCSVSLRAPHAPAVQRGARASSVACSARRQRVSEHSCAAAPAPCWSRRCR